MEDVHFQRQEGPRTDTMKKQKRVCDQKASNRIVSKVIPVLLCGAAGYATWVYVAQICGWNLLF